MCTECGARVLLGCPNCGLRIRGDYFVPGYIGGSDYSPPSFCDGCGAAFPWATREERIFELENLLDEEDIDEADRVFVSDRLRELREQDYLDEKRERQIWTQIGQRTGSFLTSDQARAIVQSLVTTAVRKAIGWE